MGLSDRWFPGPGRPFEDDDCRAYAIGRTAQARIGAACGS